MPLVTARTRKYFVNGNFVHLAFSQVLANLLSGGSPVFLRPTYAYVAVGRERSVVFAAADTPVGLRLPAGAAVAQWNENGVRLENPTVTLENAVLSGRLDRWNLVIVTNEHTP